MEIIRKRGNMCGKGIVLLLFTSVCGVNSSIVSIPVLLIVLVVIVIGYLLLEKIVNKKWGYTKEREKELEELDVDAYFNKKGSKWRKY